MLKVVIIILLILNIGCKTKYPDTDSNWISDDGPSNSDINKDVDLIIKLKYQRKFGTE